MAGSILKLNILLICFKQRHFNWFIQNLYCTFSPRHSAFNKSALPSSKARLCNHTPTPPLESSHLRISAFAQALAFFRHTFILTFSSANYLYFKQTDCAPCLDSLREFKEQMHFVQAVQLLKCPEASKAFLINLLVKAQY